MGKIVNDLLELLEDGEIKDGECLREKEAFEKLLSKHGIDDVNVSVEKDGTDYIVEFSNEEDKEVLLFGVDEEGDAYSLSLSGDIDVLGTEADIVDLSCVEPAMTEQGKLDLTDLSWMNKNIFNTFFSESVEESEVTDEVRMKVAIRGGKKVKVPIKIKKKRLTPKQKAGLKKAQRKAHSASAKRKRAKSMKLSRRLAA
jgi:hypothetical protein